MPSRSGKGCSPATICPAGRSSLPGSIDHSTLERRSTGHPCRRHVPVEQGWSRRHDCFPTAPRATRSRPQRDCTPGIGRMLGRDHQVTSRVSRLLSMSGSHRSILIFLRSLQFIFDSGHPFLFCYFSFSFLRCSMMIPPPETSRIMPAENMDLKRN